MIADHPRACLSGTTHDLGLVVDDEPVVPGRDRLGGALEREELVAHVDEGHRTAPPSQLEAVDDAPEELDHRVEVADLDGDVVDADEARHGGANDRRAPAIPPRRRRARRWWRLQQPCPARSPTRAPSGTPARP